MLSVIIPNYNHAQYLHQRIQSVLNQTYRDFELIILDDCSTDNSRDIIEQYKGQPNISNIVFNKTNSGSTFKQWNKGIELAVGEYIWIAESDDYADPLFVETCLNKLLYNPDIALVYTDSFEVNENNEIAGRWSRWMEFLNVNLWTKDFTAPGAGLNLTYNYLINIIPNASCIIFKKQAYINSPYVKQIEKLKFTGDWQMWFSIMQKASICYCHKPLNFFRYHHNTTRLNPDTRLLNAAEQYQTIFKLKKQVKPEPDKNVAKKKLAELYDLWNLSLKQFFSSNNIKVFMAALLVDNKLISRIIKTIFQKIHAV